MAPRRRTLEIVTKENIENISTAINFQEPGVKSNKAHQENELKQSPDRISQLPESLLIDILSLLPMKDAVKTGILSKRWQRLWTFVDSIVFECNVDVNCVELEKFISFVDQTLLQCTCPKIKKFSLHMLYEYGMDNLDKLIEKWILYVLNKNVEFLQLKWIEDSYYAPSWFMINPLPLNLEVCNWEFLFCDVEAMNWTALGSLSLNSVCITGEAMERLLLGCPALEVLVLSGCVTLDPLNQLNITSPKLRKLKVFDFYPDRSDEANVLKINAPWLKEIEISENFGGLILQLIDVSSLVSAKLTFDNDVYDIVENIDDLRLGMTSKLLERVRHVKELILGPLLSQVLSVLALKCMPSPVFKCKHLTLESNIWLEIPAIALLSLTSPHLETLLVINMENCAQWFNIPEYYKELFNVEYYKELLNVDGAKYLSSPKGKFLHLKNVEPAHTRQKYLFQRGVP